MISSFVCLWLIMASSMFWLDNHMHIYTLWSNPSRWEPTTRSNAQPRSPLHIWSNWFCRTPRRQIFSKKFTPAGLQGPISQTGTTNFMYWPTFFWCTVRDIHSASRNNTKIMLYCSDLLLYFTTIISYRRRVQF